MSGMIFTLGHRVKYSVRTLRRRTRDKGLAQRCQIVLLAGKGRLRSSRLHPAICFDLILESSLFNNQSDGFCLIGSPGVCKAL